MTTRRMRQNGPMSSADAKVRIGSEEGDLLHLLDQVLHGDLTLCAVFTKGATACAIGDVREAIRSAMALLEGSNGADIDFAEIAATARDRDGAK